MIRCAIYVRVSTEKQAKEGDSVSAQLSALRAYVSEHKYQCVGEYIDDGISGTKYTERDDLQRLLDDVQEGKIDLIAITKLDRWFRSIRHYIKTQEILDAHKTAWIAIWEPIYDTSTPSGRLIVNQMMSIAQFEAENTSLRVRQIFAYKVAQGEALTGVQPLGFSVVNKRLVPNADAEKVRMLFNHYLKTGSLYSTSEFSRSIGIGRLEKSIKHILMTEKYIGRCRDNPNYCQPIVDKEVFEDVQRMLKANVKISSRRTYIFSGILFCGECGRRMSGFTNPKRRSYYRCQFHLRHTNFPCDNSRCASEDSIENFLLDNLRPSLKKLIAEREEMQRDTERSKIKISALEKKISRLTDLYVDSQISMDEYTKRKNSYMEEIETLKEKESPSEMPASMEMIMEYDFADLYSTMTNEEKRFFWRSTIKTISSKKDGSLSFEFMQ